VKTAVTDSSIKNPGLQSLTESVGKFAAVHV